MKRDIYYVKSYDGAINKKYRNYKSAYTYCQKLIAKDIDCGIWAWSEIENKYTMIIGC